MRILLLTDLFPPVSGGLEYHVDALATELDRLGDEVHVGTLTANPRAASEGVAVSFLRSLAPRLPHERSDRPFHPPVVEPRTWWSLRNLIAELEPDVVHAHSSIVASVPRRSAVPLVFTAHDYGTVCQLRTMLHPDDSVCSGPALRKCIACGTPRYGPAVSTLMTVGTRRLRSALAADHVIAVSAAVRSVLAPHLAAPVTVVPNFIGPEPSAEALPAAFPTSTYAMYAGDGGDHKGVPDLLDAWRSPPTPLPPLVLATPRPVPGKLPAGVIPVSLTRGQMAAAWSRASVAIAPSRWPDPCPTVVLEAMRAGLPVIGTDLGGTPELVRDDIEGVLLRPREPRAIAAAVADLVSDDARRRRLGRAAKQRAALFTVEAVTQRIRAIYRAEIDRAEDDRQPARPAALRGPSR